MIGTLKEKTFVEGPIKWENTTEISKSSTVDGRVAFRSHSLSVRAQKISDNGNAL